MDWLQKNILLLLCMLFMVTKTEAQYYEGVTSYSTSTTPTHGVKIKTNIPFVSGVDMPTIFIRGYSYGGSNTINLQLIFYVYSTTATPAFYQPVLSSSGSYTPVVKLANENGKIVIFIDDRVYYQHFMVDAYSTRNPTFYQGWTTSDEAMTGTNVVEVPYKNTFKGKVEVNGNIRAKEIKVETANWPDYVFAEGYQLPSLQETARYIEANKHLPGVPKAAEIEQNGLSLGEMNKILMQKIEELTLHMIDKDKRIEALEKKLNSCK